MLRQMETAGRQSVLGSTEGKDIDSCRWLQRNSQCNFNPLKVKKSISFMVRKQNCRAKCCSGPQFDDVSSVDVILVDPCWFASCTVLSDCMLILQEWIMWESLADAPPFDLARVSWLNKIQTFQNAEHSASHSNTALPLRMPSSLVRFKKCSSQCCDLIVFPISCEVLMDDRSRLVSSHSLCYWLTLLLTEWHLLRASVPRREGYSCNTHTHTHGHKNTVSKQ